MQKLLKIIQTFHTSGKLFTDSKAYLTECWFIVQPRAPVAMTARTNLEVEGAVYSVLTSKCSGAF